MHLNGKSPSQVVSEMGIASYNQFRKFEIDVVIRIRPLITLANVNSLF